jgi:hypothetical protein
MARGESQRLHARPLHAHQARPMQPCRPVPYPAPHPSRPPTLATGQGQLGGRGVHASYFGFGDGDDGCGAGGAGGEGSAGGRGALGV